jgi:hypothetical protein
MLQLLARDPLPLSVHACEFVVIGNQLGMIVSDDQRNIQVAASYSRSLRPPTLVA